MYVENITDICVDTNGISDRLLLSVYIAIGYDNPFSWKNETKSLLREANIHTLILPVYSLRGRKLITNLESKLHNKSQLEDM